LVKLTLAPESGKPVFGFAANLGELDDDTATLILCPAEKIYLTGYGDYLAPMSTVNLRSTQTLQEATQI
jgi:hypothetical protein